MVVNPRKAMLPISLPLVLFIIIFFFKAASAASVNKTSFNSSSCPLSFKYMENMPWSSSICTRDPYSMKCCFVVHAVIYLGLASYLKQTSNFFLPNSTYYLSPSCLNAVQLQLDTMGLHPSSGICFGKSTLTTYLGTPHSCPGIATLKDWNTMVGPTPLLTEHCQGDLSNSTQACGLCFTEVDNLNSHLMMRLTSNHTDCFMLSVLYALGIVNRYGPLDNRTSTCMLSRIYGAFETNQETTTSSASSTRELKGWSTRKILQMVFGILGAVILGLGLGVLYWIRVKHRRRMKDSSDMELEEISDSNGSECLLLANIGMKLFSLQELEQATNGFSQEENLLGKGTFGVVYRGTLEDGSLVAVKELVLEVANDHEFANEVRIVGKIKHRNLLPLRGYCVATSDKRKGKRKRRFLVYDFMENGSVADHLSSVERRMGLCWKQRRNIILDVAKGLLYLHCGVKPAIYHRDIKASNILLDSELRAKVADFGLAKQGTTDGCSHVTATRVGGTHGYLAPEYAMYGHLTEKSDVYSFGILILEIMTARKVIDSSGSRVVLITDWAWNLVKCGGSVDQVLDEMMMLMVDEKCEEGEMERFVNVGILCAHTVAAHRPTIPEALRMLEGDIQVPRIPERVSSMAFQDSLSLAAG
ncbi:Probable receptor-like protein kinase At1g11050 [Linum perenne]